MEDGHKVEATRRPKWHSAPWWAGVGGIVAALGLIVAVATPIISAQLSGPPQTPTESQMPAQTKSSKVAAFSLTITSQSLTRTSKDYTYAFRGRADRLARVPIHVGSIYVVARPTASSSKSGEYWRISPAAEVSLDDETWVVEWSTTEPLEDVVFYAIVWDPPQYSCPDPPLCSSVPRHELDKELSGWGVESQYISTYTELL